MQRISFLALGHDWTNVQGRSSSSSSLNYIVLYMVDHCFIELRMEIDYGSLKAPRLHIAAVQLILLFMTCVKSGHSAKSICTEQYAQ